MKITKKKLSEIRPYLKPITPPLRPGDRGAEVANLQDGLLLLLNRQVIQTDTTLEPQLPQALANEALAQEYGDATAKSVSLFQEQHHLQVAGTGAGAVDGPTAEALNASLTDLGAFDTVGDGHRQIVAGQVVQDDRAPFKGMVILFQDGGQGSIHLGQDATDPEGRYTIGYDSALGLDGAHLRVAAFDPDGNQRADAAIAATKPVEIVNLTVPRQAPVYRVEGKITSRARAGVGGLRVQIVDKNVGPDVPLAPVGTSDPVATADDGSYRASFPYPGPKQKPDLQARVLRIRADGTETFLGASDVRYNASDSETLNVVLPDGANVALASEHETLTGALSSSFQGRLRDLQETDERQDITYLANKTGWDARAVALAALADQFSARTMGPASSAPAIPQAFFYALFRAGIPANEDTLYHTDAKTLEAVWKKAAEQGVIPQASVDQIPTLIGRFQDLSAQKLLTGPPLVGPSSLKDMLTSRLDDAQQKKFAQLYAANRTDMPAFWKSVAGAFGEDTANRLQVDGKLGFLTINNAPLMQKVHSTAGTTGLSDPLQLAQTGYHRADAWSQLLTENIPIPKEIPGDTPETKRANYASYLAAQVRLSYPTAAVAQMVKSGEIPLTGAASGVSDQVHAFLTEHQGKFEIGVQPVEQYLAQNNLQVASETVTQVKRLQRVYQITPSDQALTGLMKRGIDAAYHVVRYGKDTFVQSFATDLGGAEQAALTYDKSVQIHNVVLNIALGYLNARTAPAIGVHSPPSVLDPAPANAGDVIAYTTLESLFGSMDFCACEHCRSILSPAAYLVDLLQFLGSDDKVWADFITTWKSPQGGHEGAPYPFPNKAAFTQAGSPPNTEISPFEVLMSRRPDIQHLPLTCENTNTALPYIDVVNETLEYFVANSNSLNDYPGHDTNGAAAEDLLASPQFVVDSAYTTLGNERFPAPLPFHQPLENLRRYFNKFEVPLPVAMECLRKTDDLERGPNPYGWRDILMEELGLARAEYEILTDSTAVPLWRMYGFPNATADADVIAGLSNAKQFAGRVGLTYEELIALLRTQFINPNSDLIPKLERLGVSLATLAELKTKNNPATDAKFDALLAALAVAPDPAVYGGDIKAWVKNDANYGRIMGLITLAIPASTWKATTPYGIGDCVRPTAAQSEATLYYECTTAGTSAGAEPSWPTTPGTTRADGIETSTSVVWTCRDASSCASFDNLAFRYSDPAKITQNMGVPEFVRLLRFIRLWKKLGWTIEQTDAAISLTVKRDLLPLLACWSEIGTHGDSALYRQMFLNPALLKQDAVFADNGYGEFLKDNSETLLTTKALVAGTITINDVLTTLINGVPIPYQVQAGDTSVTILAANIVSAINAATATDPVTGKPLNQVILASNASGVITLKTIGPGATFTLACSLSPNATETYITLDHEPVLRAAFNLTGEEYTSIVTALKYDTNTPLTIPNISAIFRRGWLARKLKLSVRELLLLIKLTGPDPFAPPDPTNPAILRIIELVQSMKDRSLKSAAALYLIWNQDLSGKSAPAPAQIAELARSLRGDFADIDDQFAAMEDPNGDVARARMTLVYGQETSDAFFALLDDALVVDVAYTHSTPTLEAAITAADPRIAYDDFRHRLSHRGLVTTTTQTALKNINGVSDDFKKAVDALFARSEDAKGSFFARNPDLKGVYDNVAALDQTLVVDVDYTHSAPALEAAITAADSRINYDNGKHRLSYSGVLTAARRDVLKGVPGVTLEFQSAINQLFALSQASRGAVVLASLRPDLARRRKRQQALQRLSAAAGVDLPFTQTLVDAPGAPYPLHAGGDQNKPALDDVLALETPGLAAQFFFRDTATGNVDQSIPAADTLAYAQGGSNPLPNPGNAISGIWSGQVETPEAGFYNFIVEADSGTTVTLTLDGQSLTLTQNGNVWRNTAPLELKAGTLYQIELKVEKVKDAQSFKWETPKRAREVIPSRYLYPPSVLAPFSSVYVRFLKVASLATGLGLTANELAYFATHSDYQINADGWLAPDSTTDGLATLFSVSGAGSGRLYLNTPEDTELNSHLPRARDAGLLASVFNGIAAGLVTVPDVKVNLHFWGLGGTVDAKVGSALVAASKIPGDVAGIIAAWERDQAGMASKTASYERRADDWLLQYNLAAHELMQIGRQILTSLIAEQIAQHEYRSVRQQIANAQEVDQFLHDSSRTRTSISGCRARFRGSTTSIIASRSTPRVKPRGR